MVRMSDIGDYPRALDLSAWNKSDSIAIAMIALALDSTLSGLGLTKYALSQA